MSEQLASLVGAAAEEIVQQAKALGLTWTLQIASVISSSATNGITIALDGDPVSISATNMTGQLLSGGDRVYCIGVPQSGYFIVGFAETRPGGLLGRVDSSNVNVSDNTNELVVLTTPSITFLPRRALRVNYRLSTATIGGANNQAQVRVRAGTGTSGTVWDSTYYTNINGFNHEARFGQFYLKTGSVAFGNTMTLTAVAVISIHVSVVSSTTDVAFVEVYDVGSATDYPNALAV